MTNDATAPDDSPSSSSSSSAEVAAPSPEAARARLVGEQARVQGLMSSLRGELGDEAESSDAELSSYDQHPADSASDTLERELDLSLLDQLEHELAEVEAALARVDDGTYGVDEVTGAPIDPARLEAIPTARTNVETGDQPRT